MADRFDHVFICPADFDKSLSFYTEALKFSISARWGGDGQPRGAQLTRGGVSVVLAEHHPLEQQDHSWSEGRREHRPTIHVAVEDVEHRFAEIASGPHVKVSPENTHWGSRWFVVEDPDGNLIAYESPRR